MELAPLVSARSIYNRTVKLMAHGPVASHAGQAPARFNENEKSCDTSPDDTVMTPLIYKVVFWFI